MQCFQVIAFLNNGNRATDLSDFWIINFWLFENDFNAANSSVVKFNPIQDGGRGGKNASLTILVPVISTNVWISSQNFLTFRFNPFVTLVWNFKFVPSGSSKLLNLNQEHPSPQKNVVRQIYDVIWISW